MKFTKKDTDAVNAIRFLSVDMIEKAKSGHPGLPIDAAPMAYVLWEKFMNFNPKEPRWINRDRFVLSAGHGSAMLYSLLHLNCFNLPIDELKQFRQLHSKTPGHPEYGITEGIDATTGPLGQGLGMAVGMAMAEQHLAAVVNRPGYAVFDHYTYALVGDGDLMEGVSQEAINIAGQKQLNKLIVLYDSNDISLDGPLNLSSNESAEQRFKAANWNYEKVMDGNDLNAIKAAIERAQFSDRPTLIEVKTVIGYGTPDSGTNKVHGNALGQNNIKKMREFYNWSEKPFVIPTKVKQLYEKFVAEKQKVYRQWEKMFEEFQRKYPEIYKLFEDETLNTNNISIENPEFQQPMATRSINSKIMQQVAKNNPKLWGGSADLYSSNNTHLEQSGEFNRLHPGDRNIYFGVREFGMAAAVNGITLHGNTRAFGSTFFVFSDYLKAGIRLAAIQKIPSVYIFTHDSIAVGEDGPTHEPIEQLAGLRSIPNVNVIRPADAHEVMGAWQVIGETKDQPTVLVLTRQKVSFLERASSKGVRKGAYIISAASDGIVDGVLIATGSEVALALEAQKKLMDKSYNVSVVSMPSVNVFKKQSMDYQKEILPPNVKVKCAIEMGSSYGLSTVSDTTISINEFGASGDGGKITAECGFTVENIVKKFTEKLKEVNGK